MRKDDFDRTDTVVVTRDRQIDKIRIAVGVDQSDRGDAQSAGFHDRVLFLAGIHDDRATGLAVHGADTVEVPVDLAVLTVQGRLSFL